MNFETEMNRFGFRRITPEEYLHDLENGVTFIQLWRTVPDFNENYVDVDGMPLSSEKTNTSSSLFSYNSERVNRSGSEGGGAQGEKRTISDDEMPALIISESMQRITSGSNKLGIGLYGNLSTNQSTFNDEFKTAESSESKLDTEEWPKSKSLKLQTSPIECKCKQCLASIHYRVDADFIIRK